jgi:hypothetical protein
VVDPQSDGSHHAVAFDDRELMLPELELAGDERASIVERVRPRDQRHPARNLRILARLEHSLGVVLTPGTQQQRAVPELHGRES